MTYSDRQSTTEHFERLCRHFDDDGIIELTGLIAFQNLSSKFNAALSVAPQPGDSDVTAAEKLTSLRQINVSDH